MAMRSKEVQHSTFACEVLVTPLLAIEIDQLEVRQRVVDGVLDQIRDVRTVITHDAEVGGHQC